MVRVPGGVFELGRELGTQGTGNVTPVSMVTITGFYMGRYPITQEQFMAVMGRNPSRLSGNPAAGERQGRRPVENVSWYDAIVFANRLSIMRGLTPAYKIAGTTDPDIWGPVPASRNAVWDAVEIVPGATGYRLPTEAGVIRLFSRVPSTGSSSTRLTGSVLSASVLSAPLNRCGIGGLISR